MRDNKSYILTKEYGLKIFMTPVSFVFLLIAYHSDDVILKVMFFLVFLVTFLYPMGLIYALFVNRKLDIQIDKNILSWQVYENNILAEDIKIYKNEIEEIDTKVHFQDGIYNFLNIKFILKDKRIIELSDGMVYSLIKNYEEIIYLLEYHGYDDYALIDNPNTSRNSYKKKHRKQNILKILYIGLIDNARFLNKKVQFIVLLILIHALINFISVKQNLLDMSFTNTSGSHAENLILDSKREKTFFFEDFYYSIYKKTDGKYFVIKQKEFSLKPMITTFREKTNYPLVFDEIKDDNNAVEIAKNLSYTTYKELELWEVLFKPIWFVNDYIMRVDYKKDKLVEKLEKYVFEKDIDSKYKLVQEKMIKEDKKVLITLSKSKKDFDLLKKYFRSVYADLFLINYRTKRVSKYLIYKKINESNEIIYKLERKSNSRRYIPHLYLVNKEGHYINVFPKQSVLKIEEKANKK